MGGERKIPLRTCIACREEKPKKELVRIVKNAEGDIFLDFSGKANGRGAYVCSNTACIERLKKYKLLNKTFSCAVDDTVYDALGEQLRKETT